MLSCVWIITLCVIVSVRETKASTTTTIVTTSSTTTTTTKTDPSSDTPELVPQTCPPVVTPTCPSTSPVEAAPQADPFFQKQSEMLDMTVEPTIIRNGVTSQLNISCTFTGGPKSDVSKTISVTIFRIRNEMPNIGKLEVAAANPGTKENVSTSGTMTVNRKYNVSGESYVHVSIKNPSEKDAGTYKCSAFGIDLYKESFVVQKTVKVSMYEGEGAQPTPYTKTSDRIMSDRPADQSDKKEEITLQMHKMTTLFNDVMQRLTALEHFKVTLQSRLDNIQGSLFQTVNLRSIRYLLSNYEFSHARVAQAMCELYGGHLAEIDDPAELKMLDQFFSAVTKKTNLDGVLIGGSDEEQEGVWRTPRSKNSLSYTNWVQGSPTNDNTKNCVVLMKLDGWKMNDQPCSRTELRFRFLCEVPQKN